MHDGAYVKERSIRRIPIDIHPVLAWSLESCRQDAQQGCLSPEAWAETRKVVNQVE